MYGYARWRRRAVVVGLIALAIVGSAESAHAASLPACGQGEQPTLEIASDQSTTIDLGRGDSTFRRPPIQYNVSGCQFPQEAFPMKVYGLDINDNDVRAVLVRKGGDTVSIEFESLNPKAFPAGSFAATLAVDDPKVSLVQSVKFNRQYTNVAAIWLFFIGVLFFCTLLIALRAARSTKWSDFPRFFSQVGSWVAIATGTGAAFIALNANFWTSQSWSGSTSEWIALASVLGAGYLAAATTLSAGTGLGAKAVKEPT